MVHKHKNVNGSLSILNVISTFKFLNFTIVKFFIKTNITVECLITVSKL